MAAGTHILVLCGADPADQDRLADVVDGYVRKTFRPSELVAAVVAAAAAPFAG